MSVLGWLTLAWAGVLVLALAASLTTIAVYLMKTAGLLAEARDALALVEERTAPLEGPLSMLTEATEAMSDEFEESEARLNRTGRRLSEALEPSGTGEPAA